MKYSKAVFENYCRQEIKSLEVAIRRKANGSDVENEYFQEHWAKLGDFFQDAEVVEQ